ncbi:MAG TPA: hypothetical protein ACFCUD_14940 [Cyclobacteriaceae bacterium]
MKVKIKIMIRRTSLLFFLIIISASVFAQDVDFRNKTPEEKADYITEKQKEKLSLDADQEKDMYALNLKYIHKMKDIMQEGRSYSTMRKLKSMSNEKDKETKKILTKDQYKTYKKLKEEIRTQMKAAIKERKFNNY